ncbi:hypothetical protein BD769DRAFT_1419258 [Suillus cothurnatus]|nr:hypothetical protein BD769DRAFT_1419258 [Suillus cothurnatus]
MSSITIFFLRLTYLAATHVEPLTGSSLGRSTVTNESTCTAISIASESQSGVGYIRHRQDQIQADALTVPELRNQCVLSTSCMQVLTSSMAKIGKYHSLWF